METVVQDLRYALRALRASPGFTATAVLTLALGIGATAAIFTVLNSVVLSPLPYDEPEDLVWIGSRVPGVGPDVVWGVSEAAYFYFREESRTLEAIGAFTSEEMNLADRYGARRARVALVTAGLLDVLRARPALGRLIETEDDRPNERTVAVLGHEFWQREYGADSAVVGSTVELDAAPMLVLGVMAPGIHLPDLPVDVWIPLALDPAKPPVNAHWLAVVGRLKHGFALSDLQNELSLLTGRFSELFPRAYSRSFMQESGFATDALPLRDRLVGDIAATLWILLAAVGLVLVIACANAANLFLVRMETRRREFAIRGALGATGVRLARHAVSESLLVALVACALGLVLADGGIDLLLSVARSELPRVREVGFNATTVAFGLAISTAAGTALGLFPLVRSTVDYSAIRGASVGLTASGAEHRARRVLVVGQVAFALVLLAAAGLVLRSFQHLRAVEIGIDAANVLTVELRLPARRYRDYGDVLRFYRQLVDRVDALPGVQSAGAGSVPLREFFGCAVVFVEDHPVGPGEQPPCVSTHQVTPGYFDALGIQVHGYAPDWLETEARSAGVVITPALARRLWPGQDAIGKGIRRNSWGQPFYRVVGVTGELRAEGPDKPPTEAVFFPIMPMDGAPLWMPARWMTLIVRTRAARPQLFVAPVRGILHEIDPTIPIGRVELMDEVKARSESMARMSFALLLLGIAGVTALVLSVVGLYGAVSYVVGRRAPEIGIRMALGAEARRVAGMVLREALMLSATGVLLGLGVTVAGGGVLRALLFEVHPADARTLAAVAFLLLVVTAGASLLPARRATKVDPVVALRTE